MLSSNTIRRHTIHLAMAISLLGAQYAVGKPLGLDGQHITILLLVAITFCFINPFLSHSKKYYRPIFIFTLATAIAPLAFAILSRKLNISGLAILGPRYLVTVVTSFAFAWLFLSSKKNNDYRLLFWSFFFLTLVSFFFPWDFIEIYTGSSSQFEDRISGRAIGPYLSVNDTAIGACLIYASIRLHRQLQGIRTSHAYPKIEFLAMAILIMITGSRAAAIYLFSVLLLDSRSIIFKNPVQSVLIFLPIIIALSFLASGTPIIDRFISQDTAESSSLRMESIQNGVLDIESNPLLGNGIGYYIETLDRIAPHNTIVFFTAENGVLLSLFLLASLYFVLAPFITMTWTRRDVWNWPFILPFFIGLVFEPNIFANRAMPIWLAVLCYAIFILSNRQGVSAYYTAEKHPTPSSASAKTA